MAAYSIPRAKTPESVGVDSREIVEFLRDMEENELEFHSFMIIRGGKVAAECFRAPFTPELPHAVYSVSKTFTATAVGFAISEGYFDLDTRLVDVFPEYYIPSRGNKMLEEITVRGLITMTAGKMPSFFTDKGKVDWVEDFFNCAWYGDPGTFQYVSENIFMLSAIIKKTTGLSLREYLTPRFFEPLGIEVPFWETDQEGVEAGGWGSYFKTEDIAKMMLCYLNDGVVDGKQLLPEGWANEVTAIHADNSSCRNMDSHCGYGYCVWMNGGCENSYRADGMFSQFGIVMKDYDAIVVVTSGIADEQEARDCIWRHFPKAFTEPSGGKTAVPQLGEILASSPVDIPEKSYRSPREAQLEGKTIIVRKKMILNLVGFPVSVMPLAVTYMLTDKAGNFNDISFTFAENECSMTWTEGDETNTVICGMDGHHCYGEMVLCGICWRVCCTAQWTDDDNLLVHIRPVTTVAKRIMRFHFKVGNRVDIYPKSTPTTADIAETLAASAGDIIHNELILGVARRALSLLPKVLDRRHRGKIV